MTLVRKYSKKDQRAMGDGDVRISAFFLSFVSSVILFFPQLGAGGVNIWP